MTMKISNLLQVAAALVLLGPTYASDSSWAHVAMDEVVTETRYHLRSSNQRINRVLKGKKSSSSSSSLAADDEDDDDISIAMMACLDFAALVEDNSEVGGQCLCEDTPSGVVAVCIDDCFVCNDEINTCAIRSNQALFDEETGDITAIGGVFEYVTGGLDEIVAILDSDCTVDADNNPLFCDECDAFVDGELCNSCTIVDCDDGGRAEEIDCENIEAGATFNLCEEVIVDEGIFQVFSTDEFKTCIDPDLLASNSESKSGKKGKKSSEGITPSKALYLDYSESSKSGKKAKSRRQRRVLDST
jgi:hypothetical protein